MTREELEEFENQLIRETRTSMTMSFDTAERMTKLGIKETVAKWKDRLEQEPCEDAVSRAELLKLYENRFIELQKAHQMDEQLGINWCINTLNELPPVTPTKCIAEFRFSKEDMQELVDEKMKDIVVERKKGKWIKSNIGGAKVCSICQVHMGLSNFKYCPNCGAEMESEE